MVCTEAVLPVTFSISRVNPQTDKSLVPSGQLASYETAAKYDNL